MLFTSVSHSTLHTSSHSTVYLHGKGVLVCIKTLREEAGHEVVHICDVSYFR